MSGERREVRDKCFSLLFGFKYDEEASAGMVGAFFRPLPGPPLYGREKRTGEDARGRERRTHPGPPCREGGRGGEGMG